MVFINTTYYDVVKVFESTFQEKKILSPTLVFQWFTMALEEFSVEIEPLEFIAKDEIFVYYNKKGEETTLPYLYTQILGYTIKKYYCEREYSKIIKRSNIIGKDLQLNGSEGDKRQAKVELDYVCDKIEQYYYKLKPSAYA